jgi:hypothetical protein
LSQILKNVDDDDDTDTLFNVSLTCRRFRSLAQALLFCTLELDCFEPDDYDLSHEVARFEVYSSDAIAPLVRAFIMSGDDGIPEYTDLVAKMFDALPRFINIRSLSWYGVAFTQFALHQVATLSSLKHFTASNCSAPPKTDSLTLLRSRTFVCSSYSAVDEADCHSDWLAVLDPNHLQVLCIPLTESICSFFLANDHPSICPFPSLQAVNLYIHQETALPMLPMFLSKTPTLRSLKLFPSYVDNAQYVSAMEGLVPLNACPLPNLEEYYGPHKLLPVIFGRAMGSPSARLRRLSLQSVDEEGDTPDAFMNSFKSCDPLQLRVITHIHISLLDSMSLNSLAKLPDMFPVLQELYLHASEQDRPSGLSYEFSDISFPLNTAAPPQFTWIVIGHNVDLTELSTLPLPSTLVSLSIQWTSSRNAKAVPDFVAVKNNLISRLPCLRRLWLHDMSRLALVWSRTASQSEERCTLQEGE